MAGRLIDIEYDDPTGTVAVQETIGPPGTIFDAGIADGEFVTLRLPAAGAVPMTAKYFVNSGNATCAHSFTFTLQVETGDLVPAGIGVTRPFSSRGGNEFRKLPRNGDFDGSAPAPGLAFACGGSQAVVPLTALLHFERNLRRRPSASSPTLRLDVPDPCASTTRAASVPGARLRYVNSSRYENEDERLFAAEILTKEPRRFWLEMFQGTHAVGSLRFYTAWKPQSGRFPKGWVIASEADFERARCKRPSPFTGLGFRRWPLPPCVRT